MVLCQIWQKFPTTYLVEMVVPAEKRNQLRGLPCTGLHSHCSSEGWDRYRLFWLEAVGIGSIAGVDGRNAGVHIAHAADDLFVGGVSSSSVSLLSSNLRAYVLPISDANGPRSVGSDDCTSRDSVRRSFG